MPASALQASSARTAAGTQQLRQPVCSTTPVSVAERLAHSQQLHGFSHAIFTRSPDAQQLFNLVRALHGAL